MQGENIDFVQNAREYTYNNIDFALLAREYIDFAYHARECIDFTQIARNYIYLEQHFHFSC